MHGIKKHRKYSGKPKEDSITNKLERQKHRTVKMKESAERYRYEYSDGVRLHKRGSTEEEE